MKMRDLERVSGVGRETIRYYIRFGLLPEPERPKRNVADYTDEHVRRLEVIKRLQQERYLPLSFIKTVLDRPTSGEIAALPGLGELLVSALGGAAIGESVALEEAADRTGLTREEIDTLARDGVVIVRSGRLSPLDVAVAAAWGKVKAAGFSPDAGFFADDARLYVEALAPMARREIDRFYGRLSGAGSVQDAARLGQAGIEHVNELITLLRTRLLLDLVAEMNAAAGVAAPSSGRSS